MIDIFEDTLNISASCPGSVAIGTNTTIEGTVDYRLVNSGDEDGAVSIRVTLADSAGNNEEFFQNIEVIPAGGNVSDSHRLLLNANYTTPGQINVRMTIQFAGNLTDTKFADCNFNVIDAQPSP
jgi:hypothetical protein